MTYMPARAGFMWLQDSALRLRAVYPNYPELQPANPVPVLEVVAAASAASVFGQSHEESVRTCLVL
jgi:hypothetical protein